jgi:hypothetical protein
MGFQIARNPTRTDETVSELQSCHKYQRTGSRLAEGSDSASRRAGSDRTPLKFQSKH